MKQSEKMDQDRAASLISHLYLPLKTGAIHVYALFFFSNLSFLSLSFSLWIFSFWVSFAFSLLCTRIELRWRCTCSLPAASPSARRRGVATLCLQSASHSGARWRWAVQGRSRKKGAETWAALYLQLLPRWTEEKRGNSVFVLLLIFHFNV